MRSLDHSISSKQYLLNLSSTRQHSDHYIAGRGDISRSIARRCTCRYEFISHRLVAVMHNQWETRLEQAMRHGPAHDSEAAETNCVRHIPLLPFSNSERRGGGSQSGPEWGG